MTAPQIPTSPGLRGARRLGRCLLWATVAALAACSWMRNEFMTLDRMPPAFRAPVELPLDSRP